MKNLCNDINYLFSDNKYVILTYVFVVLLSFLQGLQFIGNLMDVALYEYEDSELKVSNGFI